MTKCLICGGEFRAGETKLQTRHGLAAPAHANSNGCIEALGRRVSAIEAHFSTTEGQRK
jgi:hypothetical protein